MSSLEAKVGAFTVGGMMLLGGSYAALSNVQLPFARDSNYLIYAGFHQVIGLEPESTVRLSGVPVGTVKNIANSGEGVVVTMSIRSETQIPRGSSATIASSGVMGEKFINISPVKVTDGYAQNGEYLLGIDEVGMDSMFTSMSSTFDHIQGLVDSMNNVAGDPVLQQSLLEMSVNMKNASEHMEGLMQTLEALAKDNQGNVNLMTNQINQILQSVGGTVETIEHMTKNLDGFAGNPETVDNLQTTLRNVTETTNRIAHIAQNLDGAFGDPQVASDMKETVHNAKEISEKAQQILNATSNVEIIPSVEVLYSGGASDWDTDFHLKLAGKDQTSFLLGLNDIGESNRIDAQIEKSFSESFSARAGVINGEAGIGLDTYIRPQSKHAVKFSADGYDPNDFKLRLQAQVKILGDGTYLLGRWDDVTDSDARRAYVGLKQEF